MHTYEFCEILPCLCGPLWTTFGAFEKVSFLTVQNNWARGTLSPKYRCRFVWESRVWEESQSLHCILAQWHFALNLEDFLLPIMATWLPGAGGLAWAGFEGGTGCVSCPPAARFTATIESGEPWVQARRVGIREDDLVCGEILFSLD